jgi:hypothetical protein
MDAAHATFTRWHAEQEVDFFGPVHPNRLNRTQYPRH